METAQLIDVEIMIEFFKDMVRFGFIPGFMITTGLHLLGYGIFKALSFLNISK